MSSDIDPRKRDVLRVTLQQPDLEALMVQFPMLTRTEIVDIVTRKGPMRAVVEAELTRVSRAKR